MLRRDRCPVLCLVTDLDRWGAATRTGPVDDLLSRWADAAGQAEIDLFQLRLHGLDAGACCRVARRVAAVLAGSVTAVVVNDRLDVALAAGAGGAHLPASGATVAAARALGPAGWIVGRSAHDDGEVDRAAGADYVVLGTIFPSVSKPGRPGRGVSALEAAVRRTSGPVLAIGGVTVERVAACRAAGASGVAGIGVFGATPAAVEPAVREIRARWSDGV